MYVQEWSIDVYSPLSNIYLHRLLEVLRKDINSQYILLHSKLVGDNGKLTAYQPDLEDKHSFTLFCPDCKTVQTNESLQVSEGEEKVSKLCFDAFIIIIVSLQSWLPEKTYGWNINVILLLILWFRTMQSRATWAQKVIETAFGRESYLLCEHRNFLLKDVSYELSLFLKLVLLWWMACWWELWWKHSWSSANSWLLLIYALYRYRA